MNDTQTRINWNLNIQVAPKIQALDDEFEGTLDEEIEAWLESEAESEPAIEVAPEDFEKLFGWFYS